MHGKIIKQENRTFVRVQFSIDEDDVHFRQYPIPTSENLFKEGDEVEFQVEEERYVYDDGSEERIKWAISITKKYTAPFITIGKTVYDNLGSKVDILEEVESAEAYSAFLNDICEN